MAQMTLNLDFTAELMLHVSFLQLGLEQDLDGDNVLGALFTRHVHISKLAFAQWSSDLEVTQLPTILLVTLWEIRMNFFLKKNFNDWI